MKEFIAGAWAWLEECGNRVSFGCMLIVVAIALLAIVVYVVSLERSYKDLEEAVEILINERAVKNEIGDHQKA